MTYTNTLRWSIAALFIGGAALFAFPYSAHALSYIDWNYPYTRSSNQYVVTSATYGNQYNNWNANPNWNWTHRNWNRNTANGYTVTFPQSTHHNYTPATYTYYDYYQPQWYYTTPVTYRYDDWYYPTNTCWNCTSWPYNNGWGINVGGYYSNSW